jgi:para-aminobenzoate synthetase component I
MLLDSGGDGRGRYDIAVTGPRLRLSTRGGLTAIQCGGRSECSQEDPFELLRCCLGPDAARCVPGLPFCGGAMGWLGYDLGRRIERLSDTAADPLGLPQMAMGIYDWAIVVDHARQRSTLVGGGGGSPGARDALLAAHASRSSPAPGVFSVRGGIETSLDRVAYGRCFRRVQAYIHAGDCYQVNLARRFRVAATGDAWRAYLALRDRSPAPHSAFIRTPDATVLSVSPERFIRVREGRVETAPIKGTAPRAAAAEADAELARALVESPKDRAENLMIVDLLRNDLGRTCAPGSIQVPRLFELQTFAGIHHLVSTITGRLAAGEDALSLLRGSFPGGSITGAPKIRAMEVIEELEGERRGVYCGAIGYVGLDGSMDTSIAIRTAVHTHGRLWFWAGGGIVADSQEQREWDEILVKARATQGLVEAFRAPGPA